MHGMDNAPSAEEQTGFEKSMGHQVENRRGVGPAMASGNQTCSGICADLPVAPTKSNNVASVITLIPQSCWPWRVDAQLAISRNVSVPCPCASKDQNSRNMASTKPKSPTRLTIKALLPARALLWS